MKTQNKSLRIEESDVTKLYAPHLNGESTFIHPAKGPGTYIQVAKQLEEDNLHQPTMSQNTSLVYSAWQNPEEKYSKEIIDILRNNWLWCFNGILYEPKEGVYIQDNPEIKNGRVFMDKSDLVKKLEAKDPTVRFVPFGYKINEQTSKQLANNKFVQALAGEESAQKLAEASANYKFKPCVWSFDNIDEQLIKVASLDELRGLDVNGLDVYGDFSGDDWDGHAFGVSEAS